MSSHSIEQINQSTYRKSNGLFFIKSKHAHPTYKNHSYFQMKPPNNPHNENEEQNNFSKDKDKQNTNNDRNWRMFVDEPSSYGIENTFKYMCDRIRLANRKNKLVRTLNSNNTENSGKSRNRNSYNTIYKQKEDAHREYQNTITHRNITNNANEQIGINRAQTKIEHKFSNDAVITNLNRNYEQVNKRQNQMNNNSKESLQKSKRMVTEPSYNTYSNHNNNIYNINNRYQQITQSFKYRIRQSKSTYDNNVNNNINNLDNSKISINNNNINTTTNRSDNAQHIIQLIYIPQNTLSNMGDYKQNYHNTYHHTNSTSIHTQPNQHSIHHEQSQEQDQFGSRITFNILPYIVACFFKCKINYSKLRQEQYQSVVKLIEKYRMIDIISDGHATSSNNNNSNSNNVNGNTTSTSTMNNENNHNINENGNKGYVHFDVKDIINLTTVKQIINILEQYGEGSMQWISTIKYFFIPSEDVIKYQYNKLVDQLRIISILKFNADFNNNNSYANNNKMNDKNNLHIYNTVTQAKVNNLFDLIKPGFFVYSNNKSVHEMYKTICKKKSEMESYRNRIKRWRNVAELDQTETLKRNQCYYQHDHNQTLPYRVHTAQNTQTRNTNISIGSIQRRTLLDKSTTKYTHNSINESVNASHINNRNINRKFSQLANNNNNNPNSSTQKYNKLFEIVRKKRSKFNTKKQKNIYNSDRNKTTNAYSQMKVLSKNNNNIIGNSIMQGNGHGDTDGSVLFSAASFIDRSKLNHRQDIFQ